MENARRVRGGTYAETVTATYLAAGADLCRGALSTANVVTFGSASMIVGAAVEGADMYFNLYDYLVGPVLLQGFVYFTSIPAVRPTLNFAVLRPWSLALYCTCAGFSEKPQKIIATSSLGALPRLDPLKLLECHMVLPVIDGMFSEAIKSREWPCEALEFNTIDGTTYTMYASPSSRVPITNWCHEIKLASSRVETISKRMSGANELRESRRLNLLLPNSVRAEM